MNTTCTLATNATGKLWEVNSTCAYCCPLEYPYRQSLQFYTVDECDVISQTNVLVMISIFLCVFAGLGLANLVYWGILTISPMFKVKRPSYTVLWNEDKKSMMAAGLTILCMVAVANYSLVWVYGRYIIDTGIVFWFMIFCLISLRVYILVYNQTPESSKSTRAGTGIELNGLGFSAWVIISSKTRQGMIFGLIVAIIGIVLFIHAPSQSFGSYQVYGFVFGALLFNYLFFGMSMGKTWFGLMIGGQNWPIIGMSLAITEGLVLVAFLATSLGTFGYHENMLVNEYLLSVYMVWVVGVGMLKMFAD